MRPSNMEAFKLMWELENILPDIRIRVLRFRNAIPSAWCMLPDDGLVEKHRLVTPCLTFVGPLSSVHVNVGTLFYLTTTRRYRRTANIRSILRRSRLIIFSILIPTVVMSTKFYWERRLVNLTRRLMTFNELWDGTKILIRNGRSARFAMSRNTRLVRGSPRTPSRLNIARRAPSARRRLALGYWWRLFRLRWRSCLGSRWSLLKW